MKHHSMIVLLRGTEEEQREASRAGKRAFWASTLAGITAATLFWVAWLVWRYLAP